MNGLKNTLIFALGCATGLGAAWYYLKKRYEKIAQDEINSVKETYCAFNKAHEETEAEEITMGTNDTEETESSSNEAADMARRKPSIMEYASLLNKENTRENYTEYNKENGGNKSMKEANTTQIMPSIIPPDEYGENIDYEQISLTYYADDILTDDEDIPLSSRDIENVLRTDFADYFGEFEDDAVYIRNDEMEAYYEILRDNRTYEEVIGANA
jgi:hypothetical protein